MQRLIRHSTKRLMLSGISTFDFLILTSTMRQALWVDTTCIEFSRKNSSSFSSFIDSCSILPAISLNLGSGLCNVSLNSIFFKKYVYKELFKEIWHNRCIIIKPNWNTHIPPFPSILRTFLLLVWSSNSIIILLVSPTWVQMKDLGARWILFREENLFSCPIWLQTIVSASFSEEMCFIELFEPIWLLTVILPEIHCFKSYQNSIHW